MIGDGGLHWRQWRFTSEKMVWRFGGRVAGNRTRRREKVAGRRKQDTGERMRRRVWVKMLVDGGFFFM